MRNIIKKVNIYYIFLISTVGSLLVILMLLTTFKKERAFSDIERRNLKTFHDIDVDITNDDFSKDIEDTLVDQFACRDAFIKLKSSIDVILHKNNANGVYILNDRYIEEEAKIDYDIISKKTNDMLSRMNNASANVKFVMFTNACNIDKDKLWWADVHDYQNDVMDLLTEVYKNSNIEFIDMRDTLKSLKDNDVDIYYKTDHHINSDAMYKMKDKILLHLSIKDEREYERVKLCDNFQGSLISKSAVFKKIYDDIYAYVDKRPIRYTYFDYGDQVERASVYDFSKLDSYDPYLVFMGTNSKYIQIKTENYDKKRILLIKDSYANCFIPYLLPYYSVIDIVDPRYVKDIGELVSYEDYDDIMYFYNMNTYMGR